MPNKHKEIKLNLKINSIILNIPIPLNFNINLDKIIESVKEAST